MEAGLEATSFYDPPNFVYPFGAHVAVVEVDPETGKVDLKRYVAVDDCGPQINPVIVEGQVHGGVVQGIGQALWEEAVYDDNGQLLTGSLADYAIPRADMLPDIEVLSTVTPSPHHPLGVKGIGEAGTIASTCTVYNAVIDALEPFGSRPCECRSRPNACGARCSRRGVIVYSPDFDYYRAGSIADAQRLLAEHPGAKLLAGGHSLIPLLKLRLAAPAALIDIGRVAELQGHHGERGHPAHRCADDARRAGALGRRAPRRRPRLPRPRRSSAIRRCATAARSAATSRTPIPRPICRRCWSRSTRASWPPGRAASGRLRPPASSPAS